MHNDVVEVLLGEKEVLRALKYAARNENVTVPTHRYIEVAKCTVDDTTMLAVASFLDQQGLTDSMPPPAPPAPPPFRSI